MTFGKYKGESLSEVPTDYLAWLYVKNILTNNSIKAALLNGAKATREEIDRHNQQESDWIRWREDREREQREYYRTHRYELM